MSKNILADFFVATHSYTRARAIADGVLINASGPAKAFGFKIPVAVTASVWADCVVWDQNAETLPQNDAQRLWDLLSAARLETGYSPNPTRQCFKLLRVAHGGSHPELVELIAYVDIDDQGEPLMTIMQPGED